MAQIPSARRQRRTRTNRGRAGCGARRRSLAQGAASASGRVCRLRPGVAWRDRYRGVPVRWTGLPLRCCNLARGHGSLGARRADHHDRFAALIFRRQPHRVAGEVERDRPGLSCRGEIQRAPIDRDLARTDAEKPAEVDDGRVDLAVAAHDDVHDPSHVLIGAAANALAEDGGDLLVVEYRRRRAGGGIGGGGGGRRRRRILRPDLPRRRWRSFRRLRELPRLSWSCCPLRQAVAMDTSCRDQGDRNDSRKYQTDTHQCSPPCTPTRNLNATAAPRFQARYARQDETAGGSILSDWKINRRVRGEQATLRINILHATTIVC